MPQCSRSATACGEARLRRHIEFVDAEHGTKIRGKYLRALEEERFELLPSHTYIKGFLRSYAEYLGLDGQLYVDEYNSRFVVGEEEAPVRARRVPAAKARRSDRRESSIVVFALTAIALVTALVIVAWRFGSPEDEPVHGLRTSTTAQRPAAQLPQAAGTARLELRATRGDSYLLVKKRVPSARSSTRGRLERGEKQVVRFGQVLLFRARFASRTCRSAVTGTVCGSRLLSRRRASPAQAKINFAGRRGFTGAYGVRPTRGDRRHRQRARARRAPRSERALPRSLAARPRRRAGADRGRRRDPGELEAAAPRPKCPRISSRLGRSRAPTTTARSRSWRRSPGSGCASTRTWRADRGRLAPGRGAAETAVR